MFLWNVAEWSLLADRCISLRNIASHLLFLEEFLFCDIQYFGVESSVEKYKHFEMDTIILQVNLLKSLHILKVPRRLYAQKQHWNNSEQLKIDSHNCRTKWDTYLIEHSMENKACDIIYRCFESNTQTNINYQNRCWKSPKCMSNYIPVCVVYWFLQRHDILQTSQLNKMIQQSKT